MPMRLQEVHPALVHFPLALLPLSIGADLLGRATGNDTLLELGRRTMPLAAASAVVAGVFGLVAQQEVNLDEHTTEMLATHRDINLGAIATSIGMAVARSRTHEPGAGYLALGLAGLAAVTYSAYLGGAMVYHHGVGVEKADGVNLERAPELTPGNAREVVREIARDIPEGVQLTVQEIREKGPVPLLTRDRGRESGGGASSSAGSEAAAP